jgi:hypothetical protein
MRVHGIGEAANSNKQGNSPIQSAQTYAEKKLPSWPIIVVVRLKTTNKSHFFELKKKEAFGGRRQPPFYRIAIWDIYFSK